MNVITSALICLFLAGLFKAQSATPAEEQGVGLEFDEFETEVEAVDRMVSEVSEESDIVPETEELLNGECRNAVLSAGVYELEGRVIDTLTTNTTLACCQACQEQEECTGWVRNRNAERCFLLEVESAVIWRNPCFASDIGGFPVDTQGPLDVSELGVSPSSEGIRKNITAFGIPLENFIGNGSDSDIPDCSGTRGNTYPMEDVIVAGETRSSKFCCAVCRVSDICKSWYYNKNTNHCIINRNVPEVMNRASYRFVGSSTGN